MPTKLRNFFFWMVAALVVFIFWSVSSRIQNDERQLTFSDFMSRLERGHVARVTISGTRAGSLIVGELENGQSIRTFAPPQAENLVDVLLENGVEVSARSADSSSLLGHLISWTPIVIMVAFLIFFMRRIQSPSDPPDSLLDRTEFRLELKARVLHLLMNEQAGLSDDELLDGVSIEGTTPQQILEFRKALYEMLAAGTVELTAEKRLRLRLTA